MPGVESVALEFSGLGAAVVVRPEAVQLSLFDVGVLDIGALRMERAALAERRWSANTRRAYAGDWRVFERWCESAGRVSLPASVDTLALFCVSEARAGRLHSTISRHAAAVASRHASAGLVSPLGPDVREVLAGIGRRVGTAPRHQKAALSLEELRLLLPACGDGARGARDRALLLVGFASGLRRSELAALDLADVAERPEGLVLRIVRSKTDQSGRGRQVAVFRGLHRATCPVRVLAAWLVERGDWAGPLFPQLTMPGDAVTHKRLSGEAVSAVLKAAARRAGLDPSKYGGHSLRAGCATAAAANGASDLTIMGRTGHRSSGMVSRYVRHGTLFAIDALAGVL
jgi:integrase